MNYLEKLMKEQREGIDRLAEVLSTQDLELLSRVIDLEHELTLEEVARS